MNLKDLSEIVSKYHSWDYRSLEGYQNVKICQAAAKFIKLILKKEAKKPLSKLKIGIIGIDNSTTFVAAFIKTLIPNAEFLSANKEGSCFKSFDFDKDIPYDYLIFADDYFCSGRSLKSAILAVNKQSYLKYNNFFVFYFKTSSNSLLADKLTQFRDFILSSARVKAFNIVELTETSVFEDEAHKTEVVRSYL